MLDGDDGDTVVSDGDGYFAELARAGRWAAFAREAHAFSKHFQNYNMSPRSLLRRYGFPYLTELAYDGQWATFTRAAGAISRHFDVPRWQLFLNMGCRPRAPEWARGIWRTLRGYRWAGPRQNSLISQSFAQRIGIKERTEALLERYTPVRTLREEHWFSLTTGSKSCAHEENDKAAAAFALEMRHPFWDRRLVEFCLALPPAQKLHQGWPRGVLRRAMTNILPEEIQWRVGKSSIGPNFVRSLLAFEQERLEQVLVKDHNVIEEYVDISILHKSYHQGDANAIWPALILVVWLHQTELTP
jgi:asparagine synthase (glutamine-hydrolysing)